VSSGLPKSMKWKENDMSLLSRLVGWSPGRQSQAEEREPEPVINTGVMASSPERMAEGRSASEMSDAARMSERLEHMADVNKHGRTVSGFAGGMAHHVTQRWCGSLTRSPVRRAADREAG